MKLYGFGTPNMVKVLLTAEQLGLDYEYVHINRAAVEIKTPEHLARHPLGKIPVLEHDGDYIYESAAICRYMANISNSDMYKGDAKQLAMIDQWIDLHCHHIGKWVGTYFFEEIVQKRFFNKEVNEEAMEEARGFLKEQLPVMGKQLADNQYLTGDTITIADTISFAFFNVQEVTSFDFKDYKNITKWYDSIKASPACEKAFTHLEGNMIMH
ncbi:MAG: glutathione S-transferase [Gammaproteobacteria bacterium]|jgi:glutathione S-transferase